MSINVTVHNNPVNIRRGKMILSDLNQIKKNERDRRRRLRLEQVRQQSKEISNKLVERVKKITKDELNKLENDSTSSLRKAHDKKILEMQQKYQEDMADIGFSHVAAASEPNIDEILKEDRNTNRIIAAKRGREAISQMKEIQEKEMAEQQVYQDRLRQIRNVENIRSSLVAKLPPRTADAATSPCHKLDKKKKENTKTKKSPEKTQLPKAAQAISTPTNLPQIPYLDPIPSTSFGDTASSKPKEATTKHKTDEQRTQRTESYPSTSQTKMDTAGRYNPEDYTQQNSDSTAGENPAIASDDSSYFSDSSEQIQQCIRTKCTKPDGPSHRIRMYDHSTRQRTEYERPAGIVERLDVRNEPSAIDLATEEQHFDNAAKQIAESRKSNAQRRGEDAILREKVRRDYQVLLQDLDQISREERKLRASQRDSVAQEHQKRILKQHRKKRLDHAVKTLINHKSPTRSCHPVERIITLTPRESSNKDINMPCGTWEQPCPGKSVEVVCEGTEPFSPEKSREEQILDMLKKVERQKRLLLQEFGCDLPSDIFNASVKTLFEQHKPTPVPQNTPVQRPVSPEIRVINVSGCEEQSQKRKQGKRKTSPNKVEAGIQTVVEQSTGQDKGVQVEVISNRRKSYEDITSDTDIDTRKSYPQPLQPQVIINAPDASSSESSSSTITGIHIDIDDENVKVTPTKRRSVIRTTKKRTPSRSFQKSRSMPGSKISSPLKRFSKSLPSSCQSSPKKSSRATRRTPTKKIDIYVHRNRLNINMEPPLKQKVETVEASTQSSQIGSAGMQERGVDRPYRIQSQVKRIIKIKDTSDTSTSYASLPPIKRRSLTEALAGNTPILEMLDSSANESVRRLRREISPVSTPETPSPRTMKLPSNVPHPDKITKLLKFVVPETQANDSSILSSTKNDQSILTDPSDYVFETQQYPVTSSTRSPLTPQFCTCVNPECKLIHAKLDDIREFAEKNCPEILRKYDDLQNMCAERIASLADLIEKVRNEQKGMEVSIISPGDETSYMDLPSSKPPMNTELQNVHKLVENLEAIHNQLAKTIFESQKAMGTKVIPEVEETEEVQESSLKERTIPDVSNTQTSKDSTIYLEPRIEKSSVKAKPKIIKQQIVNLQLSKFKTQQKENKPTISDESHSSFQPLAQSSAHENMIEKLSKEILEESAGLSKSGNVTNAFKETNISLTKRTIQAVTNFVSPKNVETFVPIDVDGKSGLSGNENTRNDSFVPLLSGIPKVPRTSTASSNMRTKPPVTLHSGPYRSEIESSGHELSTIAEGDTPDTVNKSHQLKSPSPVKRPVGSGGQIHKSSATGKPSVHVAPLHALANESLVAGRSFAPPTAKQLSGHLLSTPRLEDVTRAADFFDQCQTDDTAVKVHKEKIGSKQFEVEKSDKKLQCNTARHEVPIEKEDMQVLPSEKLKLNDQYKSNKDKITSSSSNSFSGLSGISEITSTPSSEMQKYVSSPEEMETALQKLGLGWAITILKKTRAASALSSSSNSDVTPLTTARRMISPSKKQFDSNACNLPDFSDVSSISIKEASKSTEQAVLLKGRTSTPKLPNSNSNSITTNSGSTNSSENVQDPSGSLIVLPVSLTKAQPHAEQLDDL